MSAAIHIRSVTTADCDAIREIAYVTWQATYAGLIPDEDMQAFLQSNYNPQQLERTMSRLGDGFLLAEVDGAAVGYAMISRDREDNAQLWTIYVLPSEQGRGIGAALWASACEYARQLGLTTLVLWVLEANIPARAFYERMGASLTVQRDFPVGAGSISEVRYDLEL